MTWDIEWIGIDHRSSVYRAYKRQDMEEGKIFQPILIASGFPTDEFDIESSCDASRLH